MNFRRKKKRSKESALGRRRKKIFHIKIILTIVFSISFIALLGWLLRFEQVVIQDIRIEGNTITEEQEIKIFAEEMLEGTYFYLIPRKSALFYPRTSIENIIEKNFSRIREVEVNKDSFNSIVVRISEREPHAIWCEKSEGEEEINEKCYFMDNASYLYADAPSFSGSVFFKYYGEPAVKNGKAIVGSQYMTDLDFSGIRLFLEAFEDLSYTPISLTRIDFQDFSLELDSGTDIIFGRDQRLHIILDNLQSVQESEAFKEKGDKQIEYIDLRFGNKVFYKFFGEEAVGE